MRLKGIAACLIAALSFVLPGPAAAETLTIGTVNENVKKNLKRFQPLADEMLRLLADEGVTQVNVLILPTSEAMTKAMQHGDLDLYFDSPLTAARVAREAGGTPFLRRWKDGVSSYHSVIVVRSNSGITSLEDLRGGRIGFQDPDSTSGFMLPAGLLRSEGLVIRELASRENVPSADEVGYVFTGDDNNTLGWIYRGWIDAAATDPESFAKLTRAAPDDFQVIARSISVPRHAVVHRAGLDARLIARIEEVLTTMHETGRGRDILTRFNDTDRIDHFPQGIEATFQPIYDILDQLQAQGIM